MDIESIIKEIPLKSKIALCSGKDEWYTKAFPEYGVSSVMMSDGPNGLRKQTGAGDSLGLSKSEPATCFPTESLIACSFDESLVGKMSAAIAAEAKAAGISLILGPGVNIKRNPLGGRNFEYFSEDPYLAGRLGAAYISAMQRYGVGACLKHFACNSQEFFRMISDSIIDERTLRELYLPAFEYAVKNGKPAAVMCAYNLLNGVYCSDNKRLLTDILRTEWGYEGFVVSDWGAINDRSLGFAAGCDLVMPGGNAYGEREVYKNVRKGNLSEEAINLSATRILRFVEQAEKDKQANHTSVDYDTHHTIAREVAEGSAVLLKNEEGILPCDPSGIAIIGQMAKDLRYQGFGSSRINPTKVDDLLRRFPKAGFALGYDENGDTSDTLVAEAVSAAVSAKKVIVLAGLPSIFEAEGLDRPNMKLPPGQDKVITEVAKANPNTIVVLCCGSAVETPWADDVKAILYMGLAGQAAAGAMFNLLTGAVNPSGKLAETWPLQYEDCPSAAFFGGENRNAEYREGIYVGYRYYEKNGTPVRFPFGHGLSYTRFTYDNLHIRDNEVFVTITNIGERSGGEAALMYIHAPQNGIDRPLRELKGFTKVFLEAGESKEVSFELDNRFFAVWNDGWKLYEGDYTIEVGSCTLTLPVAGEAYRGNPTHDACVLSRSEWLQALGRTIKEIPRRPYTINSTVAEIAKDSFIIRLMYHGYERTQAKTNGRGSVNYKVAMQGAIETPLRNVQNGYAIKGHFAQAIADFGNKKYLRGIWHLIF